MYLGSYLREVDGKGRFLVPAKLKSRLDAAQAARAVSSRAAAEMVLTLGFERCLYLFPKTQWAEFIRKEIESRSELSRDVRSLKRILAGNAQPAEIDRQGRLLIPKVFLEEHLQLKRGVRRIVVLGAMDHIEIWKEDSWAAFSKEMRNDFDEIAEKISSTGASSA